MYARKFHIPWLGAKIPCKIRIGDGIDILRKKSIMTERIGNIIITNIPRT
jgi:hypothetical protein